MTIVSNCSSTEYGGAYGGAAGDQTGREYYNRAWYDFGQTGVYRHPDPDVRALIAKLARQAADNDNIGYDQAQRLTFRNQLRAANYDPTKIGVKCESDCSASTAAIIEAVGALLGDKKLYAFDSTLSTHYMDGPLQAAGFKKLTDSKYLRSGDYLLAGDISLRPASHVNIAVTNGSKSGATTIEEYPMSQTVKFKKAIYVRTSPSTKDMSNVVKSGGKYVRYAAGQSVNINGVVFADGRVWGYYTGSTSGQRRYVSLGTTNNAEVS